MVRSIEATLLESLECQRETLKLRFLSNGIINPVLSVLSLGPISSIPLQAWDCLPPLSSSLKIDQAGIPDQCTQLRFLGKSSKSTTLQMINAKHHPYKGRLIQSLRNLKKTRSSKEAGRLKRGRWRVEFLTHKKVLMTERPRCPAASLLLLKRWGKRSGHAD